MGVAVFYGEVKKKQGSQKICFFHSLEMKENLKNSGDGAGNKVNTSRKKKIKK